MALAARHPDIVPGKPGFLVDDAVEGLLDEVDQRLALRLALTQGQLGLVGLRRFADKCIEHLALLCDRRPIHPAYQGRSGETITAQCFPQETQQYRPQPYQLPVQGVQPGSERGTAQPIHLVQDLLEQLAEQAIIVLAVFVQPAIERIDRIQLERETQQAFALGD
ncbi:hypothetical protein D3C76_716660 [compost metagenome]